MEILYAKSFDNDLDSIAHDPEVRKRLMEKIEVLKGIDSIAEVQGIKKIVGFPHYYRLRVGDYRLGLNLSGDTLELVRFLHRKDIYRRFP